MVNDGILDRCDSQEVYGMHNMPFYPVGVLAVRPAALLAAADELEAIIQGQGGHAAARLRGTVRALDDTIRDLPEERFSEIVTRTAAAYQCSARIDDQCGYPITVNHAAQTDFAAEMANKVSPGVWRDVPRITAGEDFSYMLNARAGAYIMIGNGEGATVHHPSTALTMRLPRRDAPGMQNWWKAECRCVKEKQGWAGRPPYPQIPPCYCM